MADVDNLRQRELEDLKTVLRTEQGRRFIWRIIRNVDLAVFSPDIAIMARNEGMRTVGLELKEDILESCPDKYIQIYREAKKQQEIDNERNRNADD